MDALGGYADGPENRWQRRPDRAVEDDRPFERGFDRDRDEREPGRRDYDRHGERDDSGYRAPEPRFGDPAPGRYADLADPPREDPLFGPLTTGPRDPAPRDAAPRDPGPFDPGRRDPAGFAPGQRDSGPAQHDAGLRDTAAREAPAWDPDGRDGAARMVGQRSGVELPPLPESDHHLTEQIDRSALRRPVAAPAGPPSPTPTVYRSRRPALIILLSIGGATIELLLLFVLVHAMFADNFAAGGMLASILSIIGVPFTALGVYALVTGAPASGGGHPVQAWLRAPMAYLPVGLTLLIAAALAAR